MKVSARRAVRVALLALSIATCATAFAAAAPSLVTMNVGTAGNDSSAQVFFAADLGYFKDIGIDVQPLIVPRGTGPAIIAAVMGGSLDAGQADMIALAQAHEHGIPITIIAPSVVYDSKAPTTSLVVTKESPVHAARDLNGKTVGVLSLSGPTQVATMAWIEQNGGDLTSVKFIELSNAQMGAALAAGTVAAAAIAEPALSAALADAPLRILANPYDSIAKSFQLSAWFVSKAWAEAHPQLARQFAEVMRKTATWANVPANHVRSAEILAKYVHIAPATIQRSVRARFGLTFSSLEAQPIIDAAVKYKSVQTVFPITTMVSPNAIAPK